MDEMPRGDTVPNTPEHPTTPLEQMEEDDMQRLHQTVWDTPARSFSAYQGGEVPRGLGRGHGLGWIKPDLGAYCESENRMYCVP